MYFIDRPSVLKWEGRFWGWAGLLFVFFCFGQVNASAIMPVELTGKVVDKDGAALPGVNIQIKGTTQGTVTDTDGNFRIDVAEGQELVVSFIGYVSQQVRPGRQSSLTVRLETDQRQLNEVVVVGYGTQERKNVIGSITKVDPTEGGDAAVMTRSVPVHKGWDDAIIAYAQNGEAIRPEQGYPVRLFLPGWEGNANVKWLRRIELADAPFMTREETSKYTEAVGGGKIRQFSFTMDARSIITYPSYPAQVEKGWIELRGIAWSGRGKITRVEISADAGKSWQNAALQEPVLDKAIVAFRYLWKWDGSSTEIMSRAVDETGYVQPFLKQLLAARGGNMGYHFNPVTAWYLQRDGQVLFKAT